MAASPQKRPLTPQTDLSLCHKLWNRAVSFSQELPCRLRRTKRFELAIRVCPAVLNRVGKQDGAGRDTRNHVMLIKRQAVSGIGVCLELCVEPMRKALVDVRDLLTDSAAAWCSASATTLMGNYESDTLIGGSG